MSEPIIRRKFVLLDPIDNHNKEYLAELWDDGTFKATWGRVGVTQQTKSFIGWTRSDVAAKIQEKERKGYQEVQLHIPSASVATPTGIADPKVSEFVSLVFKEAGEAISKFLAVGVDALSVQQITKGRAIISKLANSGAHLTPYFVSGFVKDYYNTIPTQLPRDLRSEWDNVVKTFMSDLHEQEDRLDQLEAGLAAYTAGQSGVTNQLAQLGSVSIEVMESGSVAYGQIADYILRTSGGGRKLDALFSVKIDHERLAYEKETRGKHRVSSLFHGTRSKNVRHILRSGLIIPKVAANGSRLGRAQYFSDKAKRSLNYTGGNDPRQFLFVSDVALGNSWETSGTYNGTDAPKGYDSVWGTGSWSSNGDEFTVYTVSQSTIRAIALVR